MKQALMKLYRDFAVILGLESDPLAAYYADEKPAESIGPEGGFFVDVRKPGDILQFLKRAGRLDLEKKREFRCMFRFLASTRRDGVPSVFDYENFGCPGARFYLGFIDRLPGFNHFFTSNGFPGIYNGERFFPTSTSSKRRAKELEGYGSEGRYVVFERMDQLSYEIEPEIVIFLSDPETITGLSGLVSFATDDAHSVCSPFASGCGSIFSWPMKFKREGSLKAVLGVFDPAARPWMHPGEMSLSVPLPLFMLMLDSYKKSFVYADRIKSGLIKSAIPSWPTVRKRARALRRMLKADKPG